MLASDVVTGTGFTDSQLLCQVDADVFPAQYLSATQLQCNAPPRPTAAVVNVEISVDGMRLAVSLRFAFFSAALCVLSAGGVVFTSSGQTVSYVALGEPASVAPLSAPLGSATLITVTGVNFVVNGISACRYGGTVVVPATVLSVTQMSCAVPNSVLGMAGVLSLGDGISRVTLGVTNDGVRFSATTIPFHLTRPLGVMTVQPPAGLIGGGISLLISGANFTSNPYFRQQYICRFAGTFLRYCTAIFAIVSTSLCDFLTVRAPCV